MFLAAESSNILNGRSIDINNTNTLIKHTVLYCYSYYVVHYANVQEM